MVWIWLCLLVVLLLIQPTTPKGIKNKVVEYTTPEGKMIKLCNKHTTECSPLTFENPCCVTNAIEMMKDVFQVFKNHNVPLWITYGTLLGYVRHHSFIPWDNDVDTLTLATHTHTIDTIIRKALEAKGYIMKRITQQSSDTDAPDCDYFTVTFSETNQLHMDIGLCTLIKLGNEMFLFDGPATFHNTLQTKPLKFKQWLHSLTKTFPLSNATLYNVPVSVPKDPKHLLLYHYGKDCLVEAKKKVGDVPGMNKNLKEVHIPNFTQAKPLQLETTSHTSAFGVDECYIINLKDRKDRLASCIRELNKYGLKGIPIQAVEGNELRSVSSKIYQPNPNYEMTRNEVACALSHIKALQTIATKVNGIYMIIEDDISFRSDALGVLKRLSRDLNKIPEWDIVMLGCRLANGKDEFIPTTIPYLYKSGLCLGTWAYLVNPKSAKKILKGIFPIQMPIDITITVQDPIFLSTHVYDPRFLGKLYRYVIHTGTTFDNNRFGIVNERSTFEWVESTSSG